MSDIAKDKAARLLKKRGSVSSVSSHEIRPRESFSKPKDSLSTLSYMDEPSQPEEGPVVQVHMENTFQLETLIKIKYTLRVCFGIADPIRGPTVRFPVNTVNNIIKDVLRNYLHDPEYDPEVCRESAKTISEVIKSRVKDLMIPRYKFVVFVTVGQVKEQSLLVGSQCLWNSPVDTYSSNSYRNGSVYGVGTVYGAYYD